jgi:hypothetical protein
MLYGVNRLHRKIDYKEFYNERANSDKEFKRVNYKISLNKNLERNKEMV